MHISDGLLPAPLWVGGFAAAGAASALVLRRLDDRRIPQVAVMASLFFVASSISIPLPGMSSMHLLLNGLVGVVLGLDAVPAVFLALLFQKLLLGHGGLTTLGVNTVTMAGGALAAHSAFRLRRVLPPSVWPDILFGALAGALGVAVSGILFFLVMWLADPGYLPFAQANLGFHLPLLFVESALTASAVSFLARVKPELLRPARKMP